MKEKNVRRRTKAQKEEADRAKVEEVERVKKLEEQVADLVASHEKMKSEARKARFAGELIDRLVSDGVLAMEDDAVQVNRVDQPIRLDIEEKKDEEADV